MFFKRKKVLGDNLVWLLNQHLTCAEVDKAYSANVLKYSLSKYKEAIKWNPVERILLKRMNLETIITKHTNVIERLRPYYLEKQFTGVLNNHIKFKEKYLDGLPSNKF